MMIKVEAIVREEVFEDVKEALNAIDVNGITVSQVMGCGAQRGYKKLVRGTEVDVVMQPKIKFEIVVSSEEWEKKTIEAIQNLTDEEVAQLLHMKWIDPICEGIDSTLRSVLADLESAALALSEKYAVSYKQINDDMAVATGELAELVEQLTGDEFAIKGLKELVKE